jgi:hypothetical protein
MVKYEQGKEFIAEAGGSGSSWTGISWTFMACVLNKKF